MKDKETEAFVLRSCIERDSVAHLSDQALHFVHLSCLGLSVMAEKEIQDRKKNAGPVMRADTDTQLPPGDVEHCKKCGRYFEGPGLKSPHCYECKWLPGYIDNFIPRNPPI